MEAKNLSNHPIIHFNMRSTAISSLTAFHTNRKRNKFTSRAQQNASQGLGGPWLPHLNVE